MAAYRDDIASTFLTVPSVTIKFKSHVARRENWKTIPVFRLSVLRVSSLILISSVIPRRKRLQACSGNFAKRDAWISITKSLAIDAQTRFFSLLSLSFASLHGISGCGLSHCLGKERFLGAEKLRYGRACDRSDKREPEIRHLNISSDYCLSC